MATSNYFHNTLNADHTNLPDAMFEPGTARPKRSRGCDTCLRRKVRCGENHAVIDRHWNTRLECMPLTPFAFADESRPTCGRCHKAGIPCAGYERTARFVDERRRVMAALSRDSKQKAQWSMSTESPAIRSSIPVVTETMASPTPRPCQEMNLDAFQDAMYTSFLIRRLFQLEGQKKAFGHWMDAISVEPDAGSALSLAVHSLAASFYGRVHRQPAITARGARLYSSALPRFAQLWQSPGGPHSFEAVACASALEYYEVSIP